jgi:hypothetical protein
MKFWDVKYSQFYAVWMILALFTFAQTSYGNDSDEITITSVKLYPDREPGGFRGKALELVLDTTLKDNSDVDYLIDIETHSGFSISGTGFLTSRSTYDNPTKRWLKNIYLWVRRHDPPELRARIRDEVVPSNIKRLRIQLIEDQSGLFSTSEVVVTDQIFENL